MRFHAVERCRVTIAAKEELKAAWESSAALTFVEVDDPNRANIIIGAAQPGGRAFANLSYRTDQGHPPSLRALEKPGLIALSNLASRKFDIYDLRYTFTHEICHAIGLGIGHGLSL